MKNFKYTKLAIISLIFLLYINIDVKAESQIDIALKEIKVSPEIIYKGDEVQITIVLENQSNTSLDDYPSFIYEYDFESFEISLFEMPDFKPSIAAEEEFYYIAKGKFRDYGKKSLKFTIDSDNRWQESDEDNNTIEKEIFINPTFEFINESQEADVVIISKNTLAKKIDNYYYIGSFCPLDYKLLSVRCDDDHFYSDHSDIEFVDNGSREAGDRVAGYCKYKANADPKLVIWNTCARFDASSDLIKDEKLVKKSGQGETHTVGGETYMMLGLENDDYEPIEVNCRSNDKTAVLGSRKNNENFIFCYFHPTEGILDMSARYVDFIPELRTEVDTSNACEGDVCPQSDQESDWLEQVMEMEERALLLMSGSMEKIFSENGVVADTDLEGAYYREHMHRLDSGNILDSGTKKTIIRFIAYGVDNNTNMLGAGERAAVLYSYQRAYNKLPEFKSEFTDIIKIANGRWPGERSGHAEIEAIEDFTKVYKRLPNMENISDNAAVTVIAYGLRQQADNRNLESEHDAFNTFLSIFGHLPESTREWNILQAITYSGASREIDTDMDLLSDAWEIEMGTDPSNKDTDNDGYNDGIEVRNGYNPIN